MFTAHPEIEEYWKKKEFLENEFLEKKFLKMNSLKMNLWIQPEELRSDDVRLFFCNRGPLGLKPLGPPIRFKALQAF